MKRVVVCMKQVPSSASVGFDPETNNLDRSAAPTMTNPADSCALEAALACRDSTGCEVSVVTMGRQSAVALLREAAERGATGLYLVSDPAFAGSDTLATATILRRTLEYIGGADLVICGRRAIDGETGQTAPELAELLALPCVTNVVGIELAGETAIQCTRLADRRSETVEMSLPGLVTVCEGMNRLRPASIACMRRARTIPIGRIDNNSLRIDAASIGPAGSATRVRKLFPPVDDARRCVPEMDPDLGARIACEKIAGILGLNGMDAGIK